MGNPLSGSFAGNGDKRSHPLLSAVPPETSGSAQPADPIGTLRKDLAEGLHPPAAILHAAAESARVLTTADGAAIALRTQGVVVCRACSGDPTPDLGAPVNTDTGISGECLRSSSILVCHDTESDSRVDADVCRFMGIRSIAVVPLRGPTGMAGILEVFSVRPEAFGDAEIDCLRALAEIVEIAYGREIRALQAKPPVAAKSARIGIVSDEAASLGAVMTKQGSDESSLRRRIWVIGGALIAMLTLAGIWLGREPALETSAKEPANVMRSGISGSSAPPLATVTQPKPRAGVARTERSAGETMKSAASIETVEDSKAEPLRIAPGPSFAAQTTDSTNLEPAPDAPSVPLGSTDTSATDSQSRDQLAKLTEAPGPIPSLDAAVSQGFTPGRLIHKVDPIYPAQAKTQHISGTVTLEVTIAKDGRVRDVQQMSGTSLLADAASDAIRRWRYTPFLLNGKPLEVQKQISVTFTLP